VPLLRWAAAGAGGWGLMEREPAAAARPGTLYVVATPIGNLGDLSPRAREVLAAVDLVAVQSVQVCLHNHSEVLDLALMP